MAGRSNHLNRRCDPLNCLPQEITSNILSRLPVDSVLDCKLACTSWGNLLQFHVNNSTYFAYQHLERRQEQTHDGSSDAAMMSFVGFGNDVQALYYAEYHEGRVVGDKQLPIYHKKTINLKFPVRVHSLVGSCNGLIFLSALTNYVGYSIFNRCWNLRFEEPLCICNPVTREFVNLPPICSDKKENSMGVYIVFGFGYHPLTNEYKVVRICYLGTREKGQVEVYTLGKGNGWRSAGETNFFLISQHGVCWNGSLHWLKQGCREVVAFDLADEEIYLVPNPPGFFDDWIFRLCVLRSCLCLITSRRHFKTYKSHYNLWLSKVNNKEDESISSYRGVRQPPRWSKELRLRMTPSQNDRCLLHPLFALTKRNEFLFQIDKEIIRHESYTERSKRIWVPEDQNTYQGMLLPHINSFVSLRALGERNVETLIRSSGDNELDLHAREK